MVAYSFRPRFAAPILLGTKAQTIRADRKRHARPSELLQLYIGLRTRGCRRLGEAPCLAIEPVRLLFRKFEGGVAPFELFRVGDRYLAPDAMDAFAQADGFADVADMGRFWFEAHPTQDATILFQGVLIRWRPLAPAAQEARV